MRDKSLQDFFAAKSWSQLDVRGAESNRATGLLAGFSRKSPQGMQVKIGKGEGIWKGHWQLLSENNIRKRSLYSWILPDFVTLLLLSYIIE